MKKAIIYARVSSIGPRQDTPRQVEDLTSYAAANDIEVIKTFTEKFTGRKKRSERPILNEALIYCVAEKIDIILLSELSRIGRNAEDILQNILYCKNSNINVYFQKEQFSIFLPDGQPHPFLMIFIAILGTMAEMEPENIKYRLNSGKEKYIRDGGKIGRKVGYRKPAAKYREDYPEVFKELRKPNRESYDRIARLCGVHKNTVITCQRILDGSYDDIINPPKHVSKHRKTCEQYRQEYPQVFEELSKPDFGSIARVAKKLKLSQGTVTTCLDILEGRYIV